MEETVIEVEKTVVISPLILPHLIDVDTRHSADFRFDRPEGDGSFLLMCFRTPARIRTEKGLERAEPGDGILHSPGFPLFHAAWPGFSGGLRNDWVYLERKGTERLLCGIPLPRNRLLRTGEAELLAPFLRTVRAEFGRNDGFSARIQENTVFAMLAELFRKTEDFLRREKEMSPSQRAFHAAFLRLRENLLSAPERNVSVRELAARVHLSAERFAVLYRSFFHTTPHADVIEARLLKARRLLCTTPLSQKEIADRCGWGDSHYFSRLFREKTGVTPSAFRTGRGSTSGM